MVIIEKSSSLMRGFFGKAGSIALIAFGFLLVLFAARSRSVGSSQAAMLGAGIAHADAPSFSGDSSGDSSSSGSASGGSSSGCSCSGDSSGGGASTGCGGSCGDSY